MSSLLLLAALALPGPARATPAPPDPPPKEDRLAPDAPAIRGAEVHVADAGTFDGAGVIDQAIALRQGGDLAGARQLLDRVEADIDPSLRAWWLYQRGICEELGWKPAEAKRYYEEAITTYEAGTGTRGSAADARFRLALVLEDLGDPAGALDQMRILAKLRGMSEDDEATVALQEGISLVLSGHARKGVTAIQEALAPLDAADTGPAGGPRPHGWLRAKARWALARALLDEAATYDLTGGEKRVVRRLKARVERLGAAEEQVLALVALEEPEWILQALLDLGDGYADLGDALATSTTPPRLKGGDASLYRMVLDQKAGNLRQRAWHAYDQGVQLATRLGFESPRVATLVQRRDAAATTK